MLRSQYSYIRLQNQANCHHLCRRHFYCRKSTMNLRSINSALSSSVNDLISSLAEPGLPALYGAWTVELTTGEVWWSKEIDDHLYHGQPGASQHADISDCRKRLLSWARSILSAKWFGEDRYELDVQMPAGEASVRTISFLCFANVQSQPTTKLTGIVIEKIGRAAPVLVTPINAIDQVEGTNTFRQFALEAAGTGIWEWDIVRGVATNVENCLELLGLGTKESRTLHGGLWSEEWAGRIHPDDWDTYQVALDQHLEGRSEVLNIDHRMLHTDGSYRWFNTHGRLVEWDGQGRPRRMAGIIRDIHQRKTAELRSQENEARFRGIFENTNRLVALLTPEGKNILTNPAGYAFTGLTVEETSVLHFWEGHWWLNEADRQKIKDAVLRAANGETVRFEIDQQSRNGELVTTDVSIAPIFDAYGNVAFLMPEGNNITDLKHLQYRLERSEHFFRTAFENTPIGFAIHRGDSTILDVNAALCKMLGYERSELIDKTLIDLTPTEDRYHDLEEIMSLLKQGNGRATFVKRYLRRDGEPILAKSHVVVTDFDDDGAPVQGISLIEDITEQERTKAALNQSEKLFREAFEFGPVGATILDFEGRYIEVNEAFARMLGYQRHEMAGLSSHDIKVPGESSADLSTLFQLIEEGGGRATLIRQYIHRDGRSIDARLEIARISGDIRRPSEDLRFLCFVQDMTELRKAQRALHTSELLSDLAVTSAGIGVWEWDARNDLGFYSERTGEILDVGPTEITRVEEWLALIHPEDQPEYVLSRNAHLEGETPLHKCEVRILQKNGSYKWVDHFGKVVERDGAGRPLRIVGTLRDITETVEQHQDIQRLAFSDPLTALPNRALFNSRCESALNGAHISQQIFTLIIIDLDNFKDVNDTLGHAAGDRLLCEVSARLSRCLQDSDMLARLGGDEFAAVLESPADRGAIAQVAGRLLASLSAPFRIAGQDLFITASIGVAAYPDHGNTVDELFARADAALYEAKAQGRNNFQFYDEAFGLKTDLKLKIGNALRTACANRELELAYQPKVDLDTGRIIGAEALLRWRHPELGLLMPDAFIPLAEENGTIVEIGRWVIREAVGMIAASNRTRREKLKIAINLSARQFIENDLVAHVRDALEETGCDPAWLECEITESLLLKDERCVQETLQQLHALGVSIAIDDFGTGHSALAYLDRFPIDVLKIDRSFVTGMDGDSRGRELVRAFVLIADALGMGTVAEGVETEEQALELRALGCKIGQGYLYGRPISLADFLHQSAAAHT